MTQKEIKKIAKEAAEIITTMQAREEGFLSESRMANIIADCVSRHQATEPKKTEGGHGTA